MKVARGEKVEATTTMSNGKREVASILFDPVVVDKANLRKTVINDGQVKESDLK
jgi:ABC-type xylose transport system substrate-binding protein